MQSISKSHELQEHNAAFKTVGKYPLSKTAIAQEKTFQTEPFRDKHPLQKVKAIKGDRDDVEQLSIKHLQDMQLDSRKEQNDKCKRTEKKRKEKRSHHQEVKP